MNMQQWELAGKLVEVFLARVASSSRRFQCEIKKRGTLLRVPGNNFYCMECGKGPCKIMGTRHVPDGS